MRAAIGWGEGRLWEGPWAGSRRTVSHWSPLAPGTARSPESPPASPRPRPPPVQPRRSSRPALPLCRSPSRRGTPRRRDASRRCNVNRRCNADERGTICRRCSVHRRGGARRRWPVPASRSVCPSVMRAWSLSTRPPSDCRTARRCGHPRSCSSTPGPRGSDRARCCACRRERCAGCACWRDCLAGAARSTWRRSARSCACAVACARSRRSRPRTAGASSRWRRGCDASGSPASSWSTRSARRVGGVAASRASSTVCERGPSGRSPPDCPTIGRRCCAE